MKKTGKNTRHNLDNNQVNSWNKKYDISTQCTRISQNKLQKWCLKCMTGGCELDCVVDGHMDENRMKRTRVNNEERGEKEQKGNFCLNKDSKICGIGLIVD